MRWLNGEYQNLYIHCPPAHGKSELISRRLPAYLLGRFPGAPVIATSYGATLAETLSRDVRTIMEQPTYREVFGNPFAPGLVARVDEFATAQGGKYVCAGVGGGLIGKHYLFGIGDDLIKNAEEAFSETMRESVWQWWTRVWANRKITDRAKQLLIGHRWHEGDVYSRAVATDPTAWHTLMLEAIATNDEEHRVAGEALWPARFGIDFLRAQKRDNPHSFEAMYQGRPVAEGGGMFKRAWFRYAEKNGSPDLFKLGESGWRNARDATRFLAVDLAASEKTSADFTVIGAYASFKSGELVKLGQIRDHLEGPDIIPQIQVAMNRWGAGEVWIEKIGFQSALLTHARRMGLPVRELRPDKDKVTRAAPLAALHAAGKMWWAPGDWWLDSERELLAFPAGAHDDIVDTDAYAAQIHNKMLAYGQSFKQVR